MEGTQVNKYQQLAYLIGCHEIVADKEINALEVDALEQYLSIDKSSELFHKRQQIFSDAQDRQSLTSLINELKWTKLTNEQKDEIIRLLTTIAYADGYLDEDEKTIIENVGASLKLNVVEFFNEAKSANEKVNESKRLKWYEHAHGFFDKAIYNLSINKSKNFLLNEVLGGPAFAGVLEKVTKEAEVDINRVSRLLGDFNDKLKEESEHLSILSPNKSKDEAMVAVQKMLSNTKGHIKDIIENSLNENIKTLEKKKRNMQFFTIAFMGRTKAGKSTFHKVITLQEDDDIGIGRLRTTRYNRSWYWDRLRIVDTPGIGAPGGETDTEIAKSIIDEADMICYLVTNDSIQETEFDFLETIKERNKPLFIIINVKSNLSEPVRLKKFLKEPTAWYTATGQQSLEGHFNRIRDMLAGKYNLDAVKIIPLHLFAAKMWQEEKHPDDVRQKLRHGSRIDEFILSIKKEIFDSGTLKKSMSIIDGSAYSLHTVYNSLSDDYIKLKNSLDNLKKTQATFVKFVNEETDKLKQDLEGILETSRNELRNRASVFAEENYDNSSASSEWEGDSMVKSIGENTNERVKRRLDDFNDKIKAKMEETVSDMKMLSNISIGTSYEIEGEDITNTRLAAGVFGSIVTLVAPLIISQMWNPGGWVMAGIVALIGVVVSAFTSMFTSKSEKIRKAQERMRESLYEAIDNSTAKSKTDTQKKVDDIKNKILSNLKSSMGMYINQTGKTLRRMNKLVELSSQIEDSINSLVGFRILEYIRRKRSVPSDKKIENMSDEELRMKYPVDRDWEKHLLRYKYETYCSDKDREKAEKATQMNIAFN